MKNSTERVYRKEYLERILNKCLYKTLGEVDVKRVFDRTIEKPKITGIAGDVVEQSILGYAADNKQEPDINVDGVKTELKTTGLRYSKKKSNQYEAKEPMSITAVSPYAIVREVFEDSNFWHKLRHLLFVYYLYASKKTVTAAEYANFPIVGYQFYEFSEEDRAILKNDWTIVRDFIAALQQKGGDYESEYPRISSELRDKLLFIDTAPKWPNPPRFRLKRAVITNIVQNHFGDSLERLPSQYTSYADIDRKCRELTKFYAGGTVRQLAKYFAVNRIDNKSISERIIVSMFGGTAKKMRKIELFNKIGLRGKSVVVTTEGLRTEDMKLFCIDFEEVKNPEIDFDNSSFKGYFADSQMLCIIFTEPNTKALFADNKFLGFKRLSFDEEFIQTEVKPIWEKIRDLVVNHKLKEVVIVDKNGHPKRNEATGTIQSSPNFPKASDGVIFVRGSGINSRYKPEEVNGIEMYRQYIWIKGTYIANRLSTQNFI